MKLGLKRKQPPTEMPREGDLYARIEHEGRAFDIYYGYYEECDRQNPIVPPVPLYPDFLRHPQYDDEGYPFVTEMQDPCKYHTGKHPEDGCYACEFYSRLIDYVGICFCECRRKKQPDQIEEND